MPLQKKKKKKKKKRAEAFPSSVFGSPVASCRSHAHLNPVCGSKRTHERFWVLLKVIVFFPTILLFDCVGHWCNVLKASVPGM